MIALAAALAFAAAIDLTGVIDADLPHAIEVANAEAVRFEGLAKQSDAAKSAELAKQAAALSEKAELEKGMATLSRSKRADAEAKIAALAEAASTAAARASARGKDADAARASARAQRELATALAREKTAREDDAKKNALPEGADLGQVSDARLAEITAYYQRRIARVPKQLAMLDAEIDRQVGVAERAAFLARKDEVRAGAAADQAEIARIAEELAFRHATKTDEALAAAELEAAARAKALENATPSPISSAHSDAVDAALDRILEKQDREAAHAAASAKTQRTFVRFAGAVGGFAVLAAILVFVLKGRGGA